MDKEFNVLGKRRFSFIMTLLIMIFFYLPIAMLIALSFNSARQGVIWTGFTLKWYSVLFRDDEIWRAFLNTVIIALTSSTVATAIGVLSAIGIYWHNFRLKRYFQALIYTPLIVPDILMGVSMLMFFVSLRIQLGLFTIFIAHVTFSISYVILIVIARLEDFDYSIIEAAQDLGASWYQIFFKIIIPMIKPAIIASFLLSITLSIDDFVITFFVAGPGSTTLPLQIYSMIKFGVSPEINALSTLLIGATFIISIFGLRFRKLIFS
ncbi:MAG: spermidine/putrescine transport system permease protein [Thermotogaceae bacterium]|nr:spermidine/putrescine transport system permease protein [Thermotogaceae bacterium]